MNVIDLFSKIDEVFTGADPGRGEPKAEPRAEQPKQSELENLIDCYNQTLDVYHK